VLSLCQTLGGAVFTAVGQNLYIDKFSSSLQRIGGFDPKRILQAGATDLTDAVPPALQLSVLEAYNSSLTKGTFFAALIVACLAVPAALGMEWRSVKEKQETPHTITAQDEEKIGPINAGEASASRESVSSQTYGVSEPALPPPVPAWKKLYRSSGQFSSYLTAKVNPDLRAELSTAK
jgi:hypothetical protein